FSEWTYQERAGYKDKWKPKLADHELRTGTRTPGQPESCSQSTSILRRGVLVPACGFWPIGSELFVYKYIWVPELRVGGHQLSARSPC
ncbi:hypothetical protein ILYODFUR_010113, partial [Ilyodon furcidens]